MFKHLFGAKIGIIPYYIYRKLSEIIQYCTKSPQVGCVVLEKVERSVRFNVFNVL